MLQRDVRFEPRAVAAMRSVAHGVARHFAAVGRGGVQIATPIGDDDRTQASGSYAVRCIRGK